MYAAVPPAAPGAPALLSDDAYVSGAARQKNFGASPVLSVSADERTFLRFDLSALPNTVPPERIAKATLQLWVNRVTRPGPVLVNRVTAGWSEDTVRFESAPPAVEEVAAIAIPRGKSRLYISVDLTQLVRGWVAGTSPNLGVALSAGPSGASIRMDSKENTATSHEPHLEIILAGPAGPEGIEGAKGEKGDKGDPGAPANIPAGTIAAFPADLPMNGYESTGQFIASWSAESDGVAGVSAQGVFSFAESGGNPFAFIRPVPQIRVISGSTPPAPPSVPRVLQYDLRTGWWDEVPNPPAFAYEVSAASLGDGRILLFGGIKTDGTRAASSDTYEFMPATNSWRVAAPMNVARKRAVGAFCKGRLFVFGGTTSENAAAPVEEYDPATNRWILHQGNPAGLSAVSAVAIESKIYVFGGGVLAIYDTEKQVWHSVPSPLPWGASPLALEDGSGNILTLGNSIFRYSPSTGEWALRGRIPPEYFSPTAMFRSGSTACLIDGILRVENLDLDSIRELRMKR